MTLDEYRKYLGWSWNRLAREADLDAKTVKRAREGIPVSGWTANKLAGAISRGLGRTITFHDIEGLNVSDWNHFHEE